MAHQRKFRFAAQLSSSKEKTGASWAAQAKKAEDLGYSCLHLPDHFGDQFAPIPAMMAAADATSTLRIGAMVFDNDYRHPIMLAKEAATVDVLSGGRLELSLGAGWMKTDYEQSGMPYDEPRVRVDRFEEGVQVIKGLLSAQGPYSFSGQHYRIKDHTPSPKPIQQPHPPLILGGGAKRVLSIAGRQADIVGVNVDLRGGTGDPDVAPNAIPSRTKEKINWIKEAAGDRFAELELHTLVGFGMITDDQKGVIDAMAPHFGIDPADASHVPIALIGTLEQIIDELEWRRENYQISYFSFDASLWEDFAPVVEKLAGT